MPEKTVYRWVGEILPVMQIGQQRLIPIEAVEEYERAHTKLDAERVRVRQQATPPVIDKTRPHGKTS